MADRRVIGIDAGGTKLLGGVVDERLVVHHRTRRVWGESERASPVGTIVDAVEELRAAAPDVEAVAFGIPSLIDRRRGTSLMSVHLSLEDVPFRDVMSERLGLPVYIDNDGNCATLAEHRHGAARGADHAVLLTLGTGIGSGIVINGDLYRGSIGSGAELGHMVVDLDGPLCRDNCPNRGCLEAVASGPVIARLGEEAARADPDSGLGRALARHGTINGPRVTELALDGDEAARAVLAAVGRNLGVGIANIANIFNPEVVVIGGGAAAGGNLLLEPARAELRRRALRPNRDGLRVVSAQFGPEAGMLGAAVLALEETSRLSG